MKRKLIIAMITTGLATMNLSSGFNQLSSINEPVRVDNRMGRGPNCLGRGLCSITGSGQMARNPNTQFSSELSFDGKGNMLMKIERKDLSNEVFREQFKDNEFILFDGFNIPSEITESMGAKSIFKIPEGVYPVILTETEVTVVFDLQLR